MYPYQNNISHANIYTYSNLKGINDINKYIGPSTKTPCTEVTSYREIIL